MPGILSFYCVFYVLLMAVCIRKWRCFHMGNPNLLPYETIVRATSGDPEAVDEVLQHYSRRIRTAAIENGHINRDSEDGIRQQLVTALFKFREPFPKKQTEKAGKKRNEFDERMVAEITLRRPADKPQTVRERPIQEQSGGGACCKRSPGRQIHRLARWRGWGTA